MGIQGLSHSFSRTLLPVKKCSAQVLDSLALDNVGHNFHQNDLSFIPIKNLIFFPSFQIKEHKTRSPLEDWLL